VRRWPSFSAGGWTRALFGLTIPTTWRNTAEYAEGHSVEGHWQEITRQVQGNLTGQIVDGDLEGGVVGPGVAAEISLRATGRRQIMIIMPQGGDVNHVTVVLERKAGDPTVRGMREGNLRLLEFFNLIDTEPRADTVRARLAA
jgi:hypothetical protein